MQKDQGSKSLSSGNTFISEAALDIANYQSPFIYFYDLGSNSKPRWFTDESVYPELLVSDEAQNTCPSNISTTLPTWDELYALRDSIDATQGYLYHLIDAGNTDDLLYQIQTANPGQANKLKKILLQISPYLSDTSMVSSTDIEAVLPPVMLANILGANPRAAKSSAVLNALSKRTHPLPPPFLNEILLGRDSVSHSEVVAANLGTFMSQKNRMLNQIAFDLRNDTINANSADSLILLLTEDNTLYSDYMLISYYLYLLNVDAALYLMNEIPTKYELSSYEEREYTGMLELINIQADLISQNQTYSDLDDAQKSTLYALAEDSIIRSGAIARNIIASVDSVEITYGVVIPVIDSTKNKGNTSSLPKLAFAVSPNPAEDYFVVDYQLPTTDVKNSFILLYNSDNKVVYKQDITKYWYQLLVETDDINPGFYVCKLYQNGVELSSESIIIKEADMTALELSQAQRLQNDFVNGTEILEVYPNPAKDFVNVYVSTTLSKENIIEVVDASGKQIIKHQLTTNNYTIDFSLFSAGVYSVNLLVDGEIISSKTIVKK